jgi:hypothetical protein|tara:strand:- start:2011 stop:2721 length:711 start_codon:yes stop_codon:yes gene_type:complete
MKKDKENFYKSKNLFCFWADNNPMSNTRKKCLESLKNTGMNVKFLDKNAINEWIVDDYPFHEGYDALSATHKSDYLRAYFMHHYGGGYTDIKYLDYSWLPAFKNLVESDNYIEGYPEVGVIGITRKKGMIFFIKHALKVNKLIGCGAFLCKPNTPFTKSWIDGVHSIMDKKIEKLKNNPASGPLDYINMKLEDGSRSKYPLTHSAFSGENFHPVCVKFIDKLGRSLQTPNFKLEYK